jgi:hypothetical protein
MSDIFSVRLSTVPELKQCPEASQQFGFFFVILYFAHRSYEILIAYIFLLIKIVFSILIPLQL